MKALCDTHVLLWYLEGRQEMFSPRSQAFLMDERNTLCFSDASIWELAIKASLRKDLFPHDPQRIVDELLDQGFEETRIRLRHIVAVQRLPLLHRDPFDRLLMMQAEVDRMLFLSADSQIMQYQKEYVVDVRA